MINGPRVVIRLVGGPAHDFVVSVPLEQLPPFITVGVGPPMASYYPDRGTAEAEVRIFRYASDITH